MPTLAIFDRSEGEKWPVGSDSLKCDWPKGLIPPNCPCGSSTQGAIDLVLLLEESDDVSQGAIAVLFVRL